MKRWLVGGLVLAILAGGGGFVAVVALMMTVAMGGSSEAVDAAPVVAVGQQGEPTVFDTEEQRENAKTIVAVGLRLKVPERGLVVALATALQESTLRNLDYGDRDSLGLFQQRPVSGWGTAAQIMDPMLSSEAFYGQAKHTPNPGLLDIQGWQLMTVAGAAQAVQRSAFPDAYARWEPDATLAVEQILRGVPAAGSCKGPTDLSGWSNGQIPDEALCDLKFAKGHQLRSDAAAKAEELSAAYKQRFGTALCVTDSYRSLAAQIDVYARKPNLAARPGTSNHGLGVAMDLCGGIQTFGSVEHGWMKANAPAFGWIHPDWAGINGSRPEAWHWSFGVQ